MGTKIPASMDICKMEAIKFVASRYGTTPEEVLEHYFMQTGLIDIPRRNCPNYKLEPNELALFHDLGIHPINSFQKILTPNHE